MPHTIDYLTLTPLTLSVAQVNKLGTGTGDIFAINVTSHITQNGTGRFFLVRHGGFSGAMSVTVRPFASFRTAAGTNYTQADQTITWADRESKIVQVDIDITGITGDGLHMVGVELLPVAPLAANRIRNPLLYIKIDNGVKPTDNTNWIYMHPQDGDNSNSGNSGDQVDSMFRALKLQVASPEKGILVEASSAWTEIWRAGDEARGIILSAISETTVNGYSPGMATIIGSDSSPAIIGTKAQPVVIQGYGTPILDQGLGYTDSTPQMTTGFYLTDDVQNLHLSGFEITGTNGPAILSDPAPITSAASTDCVIEDIHAHHLGGPDSGIAAICMDYAVNCVITGCSLHDIYTTAEGANSNVITAEPAALQTGLLSTRSTNLAIRYTTIYHVNRCFYERQPNANEDPAYNILACLGYLYSDVGFYLGTEGPATTSIRSMNAALLYSVFCDSDPDIASGIIASYDLTGGHNLAGNPSASYGLTVACNTFDVDGFGFSINVMNGTQLYNNILSTPNGLYEFNETFESEGTPDLYAETRLIDYNVVITGNTHFAAVKRYEVGENITTSLTTWQGAFTAGWDVLTSDPEDQVIDTTTVALLWQDSVNHDYRTLSGPVYQTGITTDSRGIGPMVVGQLLIAGISSAPTDNPGMGTRRMVSISSHRNNYLSTNI